jgi:hypothetical protein
MTPLPVCSLSRERERGNTQREFGTLEDYCGTSSKRSRLAFSTALRV